MPITKTLKGEPLRNIFECLQANNVDQSASLRFLLQLAGHNLLSVSRSAGMHDCSAYRNIRRQRMPVELVDALSERLGFDLRTVTPHIVDTRSTRTDRQPASKADNVHPLKSAMRG